MFQQYAWLKSCAAYKNSWGKSYACHPGLLQSKSTLTGDGQGSAPKVYPHESKRYVERQFIPDQDDHLGFLINSRVDEFVS